MAQAEHAQVPLRDNRGDALAFLKKQPVPYPHLEDGDARIIWRGVAVVSASLVLFMVVLTTLGWLISAALLFAGVAWGLGSGRHLVNLGAGLALSSVIQLAFSGGLGLPLPAGILAGL